MERLRPFLLSLLLCFHALAAVAEDARPPAVCTSRVLTDDGTLRYFSGVSDPNEVDNFCPQDHAFVSVFLPRGPQRPAELIPVTGNCCPLPDDALLEEHEFHLERCPDGFLATGARQLDSDRGLVAAGISVSNPQFWKNVRRQQIRCTKINSERYLLGPEARGVQTGWGLHFREFFEPRTTRARIPPALRYGIGRLRETRWITSCVALPWGSILTGKSSKHCSGFTFRALLPRAPTVAHPQQECLAVSDYLGAAPRCIVEAQ